MGNPFRTANLPYRLPQSFSLRGRESKPGISIEICQNSLLERPYRGPNTQNVDITKEIRPDWRFSGFIALLESALVESC